MYVFAEKRLADKHNDGSYASFLIPYCELTILTWTNQTLLVYSTGRNCAEDGSNTPGRGVQFYLGCWHGNGYCL